MVINFKGVRFDEENRDLYTIKILTSDKFVVTERDSYIAVVNNDTKVILKDGSGFAFSLGTELDYPLTDNLSLSISSFYRRIYIDIDRRYRWQLESMIYDPYDETMVIDGLAKRIGLFYSF